MFGGMLLFQGIGSGKTVLLDQDQLFPQGFEIIRNEPAWFRVRHTDEIVNVYNSGFCHKLSL